MSRQSTSQAFMLALLTVVLSLCSLNAFSSNLKKIEILQKSGIDTDTYTVKAMPEESVCVDLVSPRFLETIPGDDNGQIINIRSLQIDDYSMKEDYICIFEPSYQKFMVQSREHPERVARFRWVKGFGSPEVIIVKGNDPYRLLWIDNHDSDNIKVWVNYNG